MVGGYTLRITKQAEKDKEKIKQVPALKKVAEKLIEILRENPLQNPPPFEKLQYELQNRYSRRINHKHRLVYEVFEKEKTVKILAMWTHYENV